MPPPMIGVGSASMLFAQSSLAGAWALPYFAIPHLNVAFGLKIEPFGVLVALGVLYGTRLLDKYAAWHRGDEAHTRGLTWWLLISGFVGAHLFDVIAYQWDKLAEDPLLLLKITSGISSYGGFIGGSLGFATYVWWKRLPPRLWADTRATGTPLPISGVVCLAGVIDLVDAVAKKLCGDNLPLMMGGLPEQVPDRYQQASPMELLPIGVRQIHIVGDQDQMLPNVLRYAAAARDLGDDVTLTTLPDTGHFELVVPTIAAWETVRAAVLAF